MIYLLRVIETIGCKITKNSCKPFINGITFRVSWAKVGGRTSADGLKQEKVAGRGSADGLKQEKVAGRGSADGLKQEKVAGRGSADGLKQEKVAGRGSADGQNRWRLRGRGVRWRLVGAVPVCPPVSPCKGASIGYRCASCAMHKHFYAWKRLLCGWGTCPLRMETPPLRMGDVPFVDGNAAARTFGRAHRRRPYHFSCSSMSQGCWRIVRRRTKTKKCCWRIVRRWTKTKKGCWRGARRRTKQEMYAGEVLADGQKQEMIAGEVLADGQIQEMYAGEVLADGQT